MENLVLFMMSLGFSLDGSCAVVLTITLFVIYEASLYIWLSIKELREEGMDDDGG